MSKLWNFINTNKRIFIIKGKRISHIISKDGILVEPEGAILHYHKTIKPCNPCLGKLVLQVYLFQII